MEHDDVCRLDAVGSSRDVADVPFSSPFEPQLAEERDGFFLVCGESSRLTVRAAPRFSSSIWISPMPPPISSAVAPSIPRSWRNSTICRAVLSRPRFRYRFALRRAKRGLKNWSQPRALQQLVTRGA